MQAASFAKNIFKSDFLIALCNSIKEGTAIVEKSSRRIIFCNASWLAMFEVGSFVEVDMGRVDELRRVPLTSVEIQSRIDEIGRRGQWTEQVEYVSAGGKPFWGELNVRCFSYQENDYFLLVIDRIDSEKRSEQRIEEDRQRFEALLEHASMGIIETDNDAVIVTINEFAARLFGYEKEEIVGKPIEFLIPSRFHRKHIGHRDGYIRHPNNRPMGVGLDLFAIKKDGTEFPVEVSLSSYHRGSDRFVIAFVSDISIRKKGELDIKQLNDQLEETVELRTRELKKAVRDLEDSKEELSRSLEKEKELSELKSRFVSMASHEFRTPLSTVLSSAYLLEKYNAAEDQPKRQRHLARIISSVNMLTDILNDFLSVGKIEEGKIYVRYSDFDIQKTVGDVVDELKNTLKKNQDVRYEHEGGSMVHLDASLLKHILMNLVSNASKFSPAEAAIDIRTACLEGQVSLSVKDSGIGISAEDQQHLMERFFRGTNAINIQGTGLGLHIVSKYTELMNGNITCKSELHQGTEFTVLFNQSINHHENDTGDRRQ